MQYKVWGQLLWKINSCFKLYISLKPSQIQSVRRVLLLLLLGRFSRVRLCATPEMAAHQASLSFTISQSLLILKSTESMMPSNHLILCHLLLLPSIFSSIRVFSNELALSIRWSKYWSFNFSISPFTKHLGFISFRIDNWSPCCPRDSKESSLAPQF